MRHWLMKTEPHTFSFDDLVRAPGRTTSWEGVRNYQARNHMRDDMKVGDGVFLYHSSCDVPGIVGLGEVVREAHPDLAALDPKSPYFDDKSAKTGESRWCMVDVRATARFKAAVTLADLKAQKRLSSMLVVQKGSRLSIQPVTPAEWQLIVGLGKPEKL